MRSPRENIELFHLLFLDQLSRNMDNALYAVKGGCNLRFFFNSFRYSEDLDIDIKIIAVDTLKNKMDRIFTSTPFKHILKTHDISIGPLLQPKQTETTQRWKLSLKTPAPLPLNTKIEFSRHNMDDALIYASVNPTILQHYHLTPILCSHYNAASAFIQKVKALAGRPQTQARDVFDLFLLNGTIVETDKNKLKKSVIDNAQNNAFGISFADFKSQVVSYLSPEYQAQYDSPLLWEKIVLDLTQQLETLKQ